MKTIFFGLLFFPIMLIAINFFKTGNLVISTFHLFFLLIASFGLFLFGRES